MKYPKVLNARPMDGYRLLIDFSTGETKIFDVTPYIEGEWFGKLRDPGMFGSVRPCGSTVEWAGGQDIAPHELYELSSPFDVDIAAPEDIAAIAAARKEYEAGETTNIKDINWD